MEQLMHLNRRTILKWGGLMSVLPIADDATGAKSVPAGIKAGVAGKGRRPESGIAPLNEGWHFHKAYTPELTSKFTPGEQVVLPHSAVEVPYNYFDETIYQHPFGYQTILEWREEFVGAETFLVFDGAMANAVVYVNGQEAVSHTDGYTPFEARLTGLLRPGKNLVAVRIDGAENPDIPPFGGNVDYLTYAGIYRDVWLKIVPAVSIRAFRIETPHASDADKTVKVHCALFSPQGLPFGGTLSASLKDAAGRVIRKVEEAASGETTTLVMEGLKGLALWDVDTPVLYTLEVTLSGEHGVDQASSCFGFRTAEFRSDGFFLNGRRLKLVGLNRHQSYPYAGYAMGRRAQERDAEILKKTLKLNMVRTSHYPQSRWFLDQCDRIGLLVFEELPGWGHIGGDLWKTRSVENVRAMIRRDWNHPSIILWGVRINESDDNHDFYTETNRAARETDPDRQTGGVRYQEKSELLEDVYTMNDFDLKPVEGQRLRSVRNPRDVTGLDRDAPYLITEFNGHMWPTKRYDQIERHVEHVKRYLETLDSVYGRDNIAGCIGWCMADYNTHYNFGSGDRICHHGVLDMFREPKFAAYVYISQCDPDDEAVLTPVSWWSTGDRSGGGIYPLMVLTNCDEVELRFGHDAIRRQPARELYRNLPHPPVIFDDFTEEEQKKAGWWVRDCVLTGFVRGQAVKTVSLSAHAVPTTLQVEADATTLSSSLKDSTRVIIRALDQAGHPLPFFEEPIQVSVCGPARPIGPKQLSLRGGIAGLWLETLGKAGDIVLTVSSPRFDDVSVKLKVV